VSVLVFFIGVDIGVGVGALFFDFGLRHRFLSL
jgi:hypothetical protein